MITVAMNPHSSLFDLTASKPATPVSEEVRDYAEKVKVARAEMEAALPPVLKNRVRAGDL